jgi:geranylgeranyl diphosphate synthase type II
MCLKKTSWCTCIFPCRAGALIRGGESIDLDRLYTFGWYLGAAFQIQDDILNLAGDYAAYGKKIAGDLCEGKRNLMLIHLLRHAGSVEREAVRRFLGKPRQERSRAEVEALHRRLEDQGSINFARALAGAAVAAGEVAFAALPDSEDKAFLLDTARYVIERDR